MDWPKNNPIAELLGKEIGVIKSVSISALKRPYTPVIVRISWDEMYSMRDPKMDTTGVAVSGSSRRADSTRVITPAWTGPDVIESWIEEMAWASGACDFVRFCKSGTPDGTPNHPGSTVRYFFGRSEYQINGQDLAIGESADDDQISEAAREGWWEWMFQFLYGRDKGSSGKIFFSSWLAKGKDLLPDGSRPLPFPGWREDKWLAIAKDFETINEPGQGLRIVYDLDHRRINPRA